MSDLPAHSSLCAVLRPKGALLYNISNANIVHIQDTRLKDNQSYAYMQIQTNTHFETYNPSVEEIPKH